MKTYTPSAQNIERQWFEVDAGGQTLGRLASNVAVILRGKHKREFSPHADLGDFVVIINAEKVRVSGNKLAGKIYYRHSGYPGGIRSESLAQLLARRPERAVEMAIRGMLPGNSLGDQMYRRLKVYAGPKHPHTAQTPLSFAQAAGVALRTRPTKEA